VVVRAKWKNGKNGALMWLWGIEPTPPPMGGLEVKAGVGNRKIIKHLIHNIFSKI
jgi:hypothetical protein